MGYHHMPLPVLVGTTSMAVERVQVRLLGGFRVDTPGGSLDVPVSAQRLVAYLALQERPVHRRRIAGTLWPEVDDDRSAACLRSTLWRAQRSGRLIEASRDSLRLQPTVDVDARRLATYADLLVERGEVAGVPADIRFDRDLLPGWYEDWVVEERERLRQLMLRALACLVPVLIDHERADEAVELGQQAVRLEPLSETSHQALISAYLAAGDRARALRQFQEHTELLRSELGLAPSDTTLSLVRHLLPDAP
jgi:DNA-binding SARP family transcriptional activator